MIGPILLLVSWALLRLERKNLRVLGFDFPAQRLRQFGLGFLITGGAAAAQQWSYAFSTGDTWNLNPTLTFGLLWQHARWVINSVLFEELLFRGYLLYQAIKFLGERRAVWLSAIVFGIYHWFTMGVLGNPVAMGYVFLLTGAFGGMCALAFAKTKSIAAPIGLHLGWNLISYAVFSSGPLGAALLVPASGVARMKATGASGLLLGFGLQLALSGVVIAVILRHRLRGNETMASS